MCFKDFFLVYVKNDYSIIIQICSGAQKPQKMHHIQRSRAWDFGFLGILGSSFEKGQNLGISSKITYKYQLLLLV